jgi:hypothetical protein
MFVTAIVSKQLPRHQRPRPTLAEHLTPAQSPSPAKQEGNAAPEVRPAIHEVRRYTLKLRRAQNFLAIVAEILDIQGTYNPLSDGRPDPGNAVWSDPATNSLLVRAKPEMHNALAVQIRFLDQ